MADSVAPTSEGLRDDLARAIHFHFHDDDCACCGPAGFIEDSTYAALADTLLPVVEAAVTTATETLRQENEALRCEHPDQSGDPDDSHKWTCNACGRIQWTYPHPSLVAERDALSARIEAAPVLLGDLEETQAALFRHVQKLAEEAVLLGSQIRRTRAALSPQEGSAE